MLPRVSQIRCGKKPWLLQSNEGTMLFRKPGVRRAKRGRLPQPPVPRLQQPLLKRVQRVSPTSNTRR